MAIADAARAASRTIQQMMVERELAKRQAMQDELARLRIDIERQRLVGDQEDRVFNRDRLTKQDARNERLDAAAETDKVFGRAKDLGDQIPADVRLSADDPAVATLQRGGLDSLLTGVDPTLGSRQMQGYSTLPGSNVAGEVTQQESKPKPTGFIKTRSQKQLDTDADNARQAETLSRELARDAETGRHNRAMEARQPQGRETFEEWQRKQDYRNQTGSSTKLPARVGSYLLDLRGRHRSFDDALQELQRTLANAPDETFDRLGAATALRQLYAQPTGANRFDDLLSGAESGPLLGGAPDRRSPAAPPGGGTLTRAELRAVAQRLGISEQAAEQQATSRGLRID